MFRNLIWCLAALMLALAAAPASAALNVLASVPEWAALAKEVGGERVSASSATNALQDPHRVDAKPSLIAGARGESGLASGMLPHRLAQRLQRPLIAEVIDLQPEADGGWRVVQALPRGARRSWRLERGAAGGSSAAPPRCWSAASAWHGARICACATPGWPRSRAASRTAAPHPARAPARWWWRPRPGHPSRPGASADRLHPSRPRAARRAWPAPPAPQPRRDRAARC